VPAVIEIARLRAGYGALTVLWDVDLTIPSGQLTAIVGPNGAGKSTLLRVLMGLVPATQGEVRQDGQRVDRRATWDIVAGGTTLVAEGRLIFRDMTVVENLTMGAYVRRRASDATADLDKVFDLFPRLRDRRSQVAGSLSGGEAQMLAIGRALMSRPRTLLIDEPSLGLAPIVVQEVFAALARLKGEGRTIVLVEQNTRIALKVADHACLLRGGKVLLAKPAGEIDLERLHDLYFARGPAG
jgi:branched-chain amino acid transport system ATP-binding protein